MAEDKNTGNVGGDAPDIPLSQIEDAVVIEAENGISNRRATSSIIPLLGAGALAGAIGFGAAMLLPAFSRYFQVDTGVTDGLAAQNAELGVEITALRAEIAALSLAVADAPDNAAMDGLRVQQDTAGQVAADQSGLLDALSMRITDLENRPIPDVGATAQAVATYERELAAMRKMFAAELERVEVAQVASTAAQANAAIQSDEVGKKLALAGLQKAVETGAGFEEWLDQLGDARVAVPDVLLGAAATGVVTLAALQEQFPDAARAALDAAIRAEVAAGTTNRIGAFLQTQLGTRSISPQDGDGADAVLSRAEEALRNADISGAISQLAALSDAGVQPMADWIALAQSRQSIVEALAELTAQMGF